MYGYMWLYIWFCICGHIKNKTTPHLVVIKSTIIPGTTQNIVKIIPRYDEIIRRMNNQRGVYLFVWNKLLDDGLVNEQDYNLDVNTSLNLLPIKVLDKELELLEGNLGDVKKTFDEV